MLYLGICMSQQNLFTLKTFEDLLMYELICEFVFTVFPFSEWVCIEINLVNISS